MHPSADVLPLLRDKELQELADDMKKRGQINPILLYESKIIDGRNRLRACQLVGIKPRFKAMDRVLNSKSITPLEFVVSLNLRRRQMSASQCAMAAAAALPQWVSEGRKIRQANLKHGNSHDGAKLRHRGKSDQKLSKLFGVSARYISLAQQLKKTAPELADVVFRGDMTLSRALRVNRERQLAKTRKEEMKSARIDCPIEVETGDMRFLARKWRRGKVDLILTDPPYAKLDLPLWGHLAQLAYKILRPGGYLVVLSGLQFLPEVVDLLTHRSGLHYFWTISLRFSGSHGSRYGLGVVSAWRPFLIFCKPPFERPPHQVYDAFEATMPVEKIHKWEQRPQVFEYIIKAFTKPGDFVLDPFAGSGSVLVACQRLSRRALGVEISAEASKKIQNRIG